jgi:hypothetical protein
MKPIVVRGLWLALIPALLAGAPAEQDLLATLRGSAPEANIVRVDLPIGGSVPEGNVVRVDLPIGDDVRTAELKVFEVWHPEAMIAVVSPDGTEYRRPSVASFFRGAIEGEPESLVFLAVRESGIEGIAFIGQRRYGIASRPAASERGRARSVSLISREAAPEDDFPVPGDVFTCEADGLTAPRAGSPEQIRSALALVAPEAALSGTQKWQLNIAIETDYELFVNSESSAANVETFIANLLGAASTIYSRDLSTNLSLSFLRVFSTGAASDPFNIVPGTSGPWTYIRQSDGATVTSTVTYSSLHAMAELGDLWHNSPPSSAPRSSTVLVSGKPQTSGIAWLGTVCEGDIACQRFQHNGIWYSSCGNEHMNGHYAGGYAYCGGIDPPSDLTVPDPNGPVPSSNYWPLLQFTHELGHNVGSRHTHCLQLTTSDQATYGRQYVDQCFGQEGGCYSGTTSLPAEKGTIMSYCHNLGGGSSTRFIFGTSGEASSMVPPAMRSEIEAKTPGISAITAPASVTSGASASASVTNAGHSYSWKITNGTFSGGGSTATGVSVTFTGSVDPVTLQVVATNTTGCSVTDWKSVAVTGSSCVAPTISGHPASVTITAGSSIELSVSASGDPTLTYQWYSGSSGNTASPIGGATASTLTVSPLVTTSYWVRVTNGCGSADSSSATVSIAAAAATAAGLYTVTPCRLIDTRNAIGPYGGPSLDPGTTRSVIAGGQCGVPSDAASVVVNVTAVNPTSGGWLTLYPTSGSLPFVSTINYLADKTRANNATVRLSTGSLNVYNSGPSGVHFIIDVTGYYK